MPASVAADARAVVAAYQEIVRLLSRERLQRQRAVAGGRLSLDAFLRFGQQRDKNTGIRLLRLLDDGVSDQQACRRGARAARARRRRRIGRCRRLAPAGPPARAPQVAPPLRAGTALQGGPTGIATIKSIRREVLGRRRPRHDRARPRSGVPRRTHPGPGARLRRSAVDARRAGARRSDAALRRRQRHRPADSHRPSSEHHDARRPRRGRRVELQRVSALQSVPAGHRLRQASPHRRRSPRRR